MTTRWVTVSQAADLEAAAGRKVNKSSISRFLAGNPDIPVQRSAPSEAFPHGQVRMVDYDALAAARQGSLGVQDKLFEREAAETVSRPSPPSDSASRKRAAEAEMAELKLAEQRRAVIDATAVTLAVEAAGAAFAQNLERRRRALASALAGIEDVRTVETELKKADRALLEAIARDLQGAASGQIGDGTSDEAASA